MYINYNQQSRPESPEGRHYSIVRKYHPRFEKQSELLFTALTRAEAEAYCSDPRSSIKDQHFDAYINEERRTENEAIRDKWFEALAIVKAGPQYVSMRGES